jgi:hypothetical protein
LCVAPIDLTCHETSFSNGYPSILYSKDLFSCFVQIGSYIYSLLKNFSFQVLWKLVPMSSFLKIFVKLQVADPTHEKIKFVQNSIKSTQVWNSIKNSSFPPNPLPTNLIDSNQLSLKLWLKILHESTWVIMCDGVVLNCIFMSYSFCAYNENGSTSNVKVMSHANMLLWAMNHPPPIKVHVILTL